MNSQVLPYIFSLRSLIIVLSYFSEIMCNKFGNQRWFTHLLLLSVVVLVLLLVVLVLL